MKVNDNRNLAHFGGTGFSSSLVGAYVVIERSLSLSERLHGQGDEGGGPIPKAQTHARGIA